MGQIKVVVIDDSKVMRDIIKNALSSEADFKVVGEAENPIVARDVIKSTNPDVITLDIEMPKMNGIAFLKNLMRLHPMPVVMISTLTEKGSEITMRALELGAVDYVLKPSVSVKTVLEDFSNEIVKKVKHASQVSVKSLNVARQVQRLELSDDFSKIKKYIVLAASTGGIEAMTQILSTLPERMPPIFILQSLSSQLSVQFVKQLQEKTSTAIVNLDRTTKVHPNHIYVMGSNLPIVLKKMSGELEVHVLPNEAPDLIDLFLQSVAECVGSESIALLMTGMGEDGAKGLKAILNAGGITAVQDQASSMAWGMAAKALEIGATSTQLPLSKIPEFILNELKK